MVVLRRSDASRRRRLVQPASVSAAVMHRALADKTRVHDDECGRVRRRASCAGIIPYRRRARWLGIF